MERIVKKSLEDILKAIAEIDSFFEDTGRHFSDVDFSVDFDAKSIASENLDWSDI